MLNSIPKSTIRASMKCDECHTTIKNITRYWLGFGLFSEEHCCTKPCSED